MLALSGMKFLFAHHNPTSYPSFSGTINHVPEANKQTKSAARADTSPTLRGGQSSLSGGEANIVLPLNKISDSINHVRIGKKPRWVLPGSPQHPTEPHISPMETIDTPNTMQPPPHGSPITKLAPPKR